MSASRFAPLNSRPSTKRCGNCSATMSLYSLPAHYSGAVDIDVCMDCNAIWFDPNESGLLSPDGTVSLFQLINERGGTATSASTKFGEALRCAACGTNMRQVHDRVRNTRFTYQACPKGHGRLTTFYNFLAEKQFVRELSKAERAKLAATVHQVRCSGCGAPVNLGKTDACEYCRAPVAVFDREAAKKAIDHYLRERGQQGAYRANAGREPLPRDEYWRGYDMADVGSDILYALTRAASRGAYGIGSAGRSVPLAGGVGAASAHDGLEPFADAPLASSAPDATTALFGAGDAATNTLAHEAVTGAASGFEGALPSATDALFGGTAGAANDAAGAFGGEFANVMSDASASALGDAATGAFEAAGDAASSAGEGIVDLVTDGIGSLLGSLFN